MIQYQILRTSIIRIVWQTVRRITNEILGVKKLGALAMVNYIVLFDDTLPESLSSGVLKDTGELLRKDGQHGWLGRKVGVGEKGGESRPVYPPQTLFLFLK